MGGGVDRRDARICPMPGRGAAGHRDVAAVADRGAPQGSGLNELAAQKIESAYNPKHSPSPWTPNLLESLYL